MSINLPRGSIVINGKLYNGQAGGSFFKTDSVSALAGATSVTITDSHITSSSSVIPYADNGSSEPTPFSSMTLTTGQCVLTFDALESNTSFYLIVMDGSGTSGGGTGLLPHLVIHTDPDLSVTVTKDTASIIAIESSSGVYECDVPAFGTYTVTAIKGSEEATKECIVSSVSIFNIYLSFIPDGKTVLPTDDIQTWLLCAGIRDKTTYTTLSDILADSITFNALLGDSNACDYMARSTTWSTDICADADAMRRVDMYDYCSDALLGNSTWNSAIVASSYADSIISALVPTMTSATTPSGEAFSSSYYDASHVAFMAFDNNANTGWSSTVADTIGSTIGYDFGNNIIVCGVSIVGQGSTNNPTNVTLQGYDTEWHDIGTFSRSEITTLNGVANNSAYSKYRIKINAFSGTQGTNNVGITTLQFYGRHEAQTNIIHSGASDTLYYNNGSSQTIGTTDTSGVGTVNWSNLPVGNLTIYSTVANDPDDLTSAYSKTVRITPHTTEVYVMPDNCLYWYGYEDSDLEDISTANGWTFGTGYTTLTPLAPNRTTNYIDMNADTSQIKGVGGKNSITPSKIRSIVEGVRVSSNEYGQMHYNSTKQISTSYTTRTTITAGAPTLLSTDESTSGYFSIYANNNRQSKLYGLWYE